MSRFFFDAHNTNDMPWDDSGTEYYNREEVEARAHQVALTASSHLDESGPPVMVTVVNTSQNVVMTATLKDKDLQCEWAPITSQRVQEE